ncbi:casparian strip membrane protein 2-like [Vicia villosa]|uniref:casparian strip membrane protein 2-like n=1 Tax=Vicia villosa TaxID=3911 RepID=UPI00273AA006|nr:casparian strip membrane protein 2-like [Vicia villosa]
MKISAIESGEVSSSPRKGMNRGLSIMDFILRVFAAVTTLASALSMGTAKQTMPFATRFFRFRVAYHDLPTFVFFVSTNSIVCGYLVLSLSLSFFNIVRTMAAKSRILLVFLDTVMFGLVTSAASAAAAIVYVAHYGNSSANWFPFCQQYNYFCGRVSGSLIGSFIAVVMFILLILMSGISISKH